MTLPSCKRSWESIWLSNALHELQFLKHGNGCLNAGRQLLQIVLRAVKKKWGRGTEVIAFEKGYFKQKVQRSHNKSGMMYTETNSNGEKLSKQS